MPDDLKKSLNIPVPAKPAAPGSSESSDAELPPEEEG
jgi:hypothetical protein